MEKRELEVLLTLADELHFGRTAERLRISTASVSQTLARIERRIGAALFTRTSRHVELTTIGRQLVDDLAPAHAQIGAAVAAATDAARQIQSRLTVGYMSAAVGRQLLSFVDSFETTHPWCRVSITETMLTDMFGPLRSGVVDISILPLPVREHDIRVEATIYRERTFVALARSHPLARRAELSMTDLRREASLEVANLPDYWRESRQVGVPLPSAESAITGFQELLTLAEAGRGVAVVGAQSASFYPRPGVIYVPLVDGAPFEYAAVVRVGTTTTAISDFLQHLSRWHPPNDAGHDEPIFKRGGGRPPGAT